MLLIYSTLLTPTTPIVTPVVAPIQFPVLGGQKFPKKTSVWQGTRLITSTSGREVRGQNWRYKRYMFELSYDVLCSDTRFPGGTAHSLQILTDFYDRCGGQAIAFLYADPIDTLAIGQPVAVGNGATTSFTIMRQFVNYVEPAGWVLNVSAVYLNSVLQLTSSWALQQPNTIIFSVPPPNGILITIDYTYAYVCRFETDTVEFAQFADGRWENASLKFLSVRQS